MEQFNHFTFSALITSIFTFILGVFVLLKRRWKRSVYVVFALYSFSISWWSFCTTRFRPDFQDPYLIWSRLLHLGAILIPAFFIHFVFRFLEEKNRKVIFLSYLIAGIFLGFNFFTQLFIKGVTNKVFYSYPTPGITYSFYFTFFIVCVLFGLYKLFRASLITTGNRRNQIKYLLFSLLIGNIGGLKNFMILINLEIFPVYPFGTYAIPITILIITYAIVKYRLMDITIAITRAGIFAFVYFFVLGIPFLLAYRYGLWQIAIWITLILATLGPFIFNYLRRQAEAKIQAEDRRAQAMLIRASEGMTLVRDLKRLTNLIVYLVSMELKLKNCSIYLLDKQTGQYLRRATRIPSKVLETEPLDKTNPLIQHLHTKKAPFLYEELKIQTSEDEPVLLQMQRLSASAVVPSFIEDFLIGFLVLDRRRDERVLSSQTLNTLQILANQAALAVENCIFIEERGKSLAETFHEQNLRAIGTLGAGIGHQINNRFNAIAVPAQIVSEMIESAQLDETSDQKLKGLLLYSKEAFDSIFRDALRGGRIATSLTHFSRKTEEYILVFLSKIIEEVLNVLSCKFSLEELNLKLELPSDLPPLFGNPSQLDSVFFNLLDNAHDANNKKSEEIRAGRIEIADYQPQVKIKAKVKGKETLITVEDNGIGMTKEQLDKVFVPFYTSKATSEKGTGIGLWMVKQIIEAHRGKIYVESEYLKGATFYILLPLATEEQKRSFQAKEKDV